MADISALPEDLNRLQVVVSTWEDAVIAVSVEGTISTWNKGAASLYGYSSDEIIGRSLHSLFPPSQDAEVNNIIENIVRRTPIGSVAILSRRADGSHIYVSLSLSTCITGTGSDGGGILVVRLSEQPNQAEEIFNAMANSSPIGIYIVQYGLFKYVSQQFASILGYNRSELLGTESMSYVFPDDRDKVRSHAVEALKTGFCAPYEYRIRRKSGESKWILETVTSIHYQGKKATLGNFMDITETKQAQEKIQEANEKLMVMVSRFEKQSYLNGIMTEMRDLLQACSKMSETVPIIVQAMKKVFPGTDGALYLLSPSRTDLESAARWGNFPEDVDANVFAPAACWGLRRGRVHVVENIEDGSICAHLKNDQTAAYACLPLMAKGDVLGLLHLRIGQMLAEPERQRLLSDIRELTPNLSEYLSLSIANIKLSESLSLQSIQDPLSGLFNRRFMEESLQREIQRAARKNSPIGVIMADIDYFKQFNDTYGHAAGDMCISRLGKMFKQKIRVSDIACRYGGEEFVLIMPESSAEDTFKRADGLRQEVKKIELMFQGNFIGSISVCMGVADYPVNGSNAEDLLKAADAALYKAKQNGRDQVLLSPAE